MLSLVGSEAIALPYDDTAAMSAGQVDRYAFSGQADQVLRIEAAQNGGSGLEGDARLLGPDGQEVTGFSFPLGQYADSRRVFTVLPETGDYTIEIDGTRYEPGGYRLSARIIPRIGLDENLEGTLAEDGAQIQRAFVGGAGP